MYARHHHFLIASYFFNNTDDNFLFSDVADLVVKKGHSKHVFCTLQIQESKRLRHGDL